MKPIEPRPSELATIVATTVPLVKKWIANKGLAMTNGDQQLPIILEKTFEHAPEAFMAAKVIEAHFKWPVDAALVAALDLGLVAGRSGHTKAVQEWVLRTGMRFPKEPKEAVLFRDGEGELCHGIVQNVFKGTAEGLVMRVTDIEQRDRDTEFVRITAEEVISSAAV